MGVVTLNEVVSKSPRLLLVNGEILRVGGYPLHVYRDEEKGYSVQFYVVRDKKRVPIKDGETCVEDACNSFLSRFEDLSDDVENDLILESAERDDFAGVCILSTHLYNVLMQPVYHRNGMSYAKDVQEKMDAFTVQQLINYFDLFNLRYSRRITSSTTSIRIKAHLVEGLFQPYRCYSHKIGCPLEWEMFDWFIQPWEKDHIVLESGDGRRGYYLSCVAMSDFCESYGIPVVTQINRKYFQCAVGAVLAQTVSKTGMRDFMDRFPYKEDFTSGPLWTLLGGLIKAVERELK